MKQIQFSAPEWWHKAAKAKAKSAGLSLSSFIRHTLTLAWDIEQPDEGDKDADNDDE